MQAEVKKFKDFLASMNDPDTLFTCMGIYGILAAPNSFLEGVSFVQVIGRSEMEKIKCDTRLDSYILYNFVCVCVFSVCVLCVCSVCVWGGVGVGLGCGRVSNQNKNFLSGL